MGKYVLIDPANNWEILENRSFTGRGFDVAFDGCDSYVVISPSVHRLTHADVESVDSFTPNNSNQGTDGMEFDGQNIFPASANKKTVGMMIQLSRLLRMYSTADYQKLDNAIGGLQINAIGGVPNAVGWDGQHINAARVLGIINYPWKTNDFGTEQQLQSFEPYPDQYVGMTFDGQDWYICEGDKIWKVSEKHEILEKSPALGLGNLQGVAWMGDHLLAVGA